MTEPLTAMLTLWLGVLIGFILERALFHHRPPPRRRD